MGKLAERPLGVSIPCILQFIGAVGVGVVGVIVILAGGRVLELYFGVHYFDVYYFDVYHFDVLHPDGGVLGRVLTAFILGIGVVLLICLWNVARTFLEPIFFRYPPVVVMIAVVLGIGVVLVILGILGFIATYGLWNLKRWAFRLTLILNIPLIAVLVLFGIIVTWTLLHIGVITPVIIVMYLIIVRGHFE